MIKPGVSIAGLRPEVVFGLAEREKPQQVDEVYEELRAIFAEKGAPFFSPLGQHEWNNAIRSRFNAHRFELITRDGKAGWVPPLVSAAEVTE